MAKASSNWDLSDGMNVDYSGSKEIAAADKSFRDAQSIIDTAYNLDREGETQQSTIDALNAKNQAYIDTVDLETELKNAKNQATLDDYAAKSELEAALQAAEGYASDTKQEEITPEKRELIGYTEQNIEGRNVQVPQYKVTPEQRTPATQTQRPRTQLERLKAALPLLTSPSARTAAQDAIRKEITNQAYQLHAFEPDQALKMLRENGLGVSTSLERAGDGTFKQVLSDGQIKTYSQLDASAMVGDIIKGTNDLHKTMVMRQKEAVASALQAAKDKAAENREDIRYQRAVDVAQVSAQAKVGAGRYGRASSFDEDGNLIVGGGGGGGGGSGGANPAAPPDSSSVISGQSAAPAGLDGKKGENPILLQELSKAEQRLAKEQSALQSDPQNEEKKLALNRTQADIKSLNRELGRSATSVPVSSPNAGVQGTPIENGFNAAKLSPDQIEAQLQTLNDVLPSLRKNGGTATLKYQEAVKLQEKLQKLKDANDLKEKAIDPSVPPGDMPKRTATQGDKEYKASLKTWANQKMQYDQYMREKKDNDSRIARNLKAGIRL